MKIIITGPILGSNKAREKSQAEFLINLLNRRKFDVRWASSSPKRIPRAIEITKCILGNKDADVGIVMVFSYGAFLYADIASFLMQKHGIPVIFWLHGGALPEFSRKYFWWVKKVLKRGMVLIAPSEYLGDFYRQLGFRVEFVRNIIEIEKYQFRPREKLSSRFLWMRTFEDIYNPEMALRAFKIILRHIPDATLTMAGAYRKGYEERLRKLAKQFGIMDRIEFPGFLDGEKKYEALKTHDIYLHTNNVDNTPVSVIEALASGLIVIGTNVGGIPYLLKHKQNAFLVNPNDSEKMAYYAIRILQGKYDLTKIQANGLKLAQEFSSKRVINQWIELIKELKND